MEGRQREEIEGRKADNLIGMPPASNIDEIKLTAAQVRYKNETEKAEEMEVTIQPPKTLTEMLGGFRCPKKSGSSKETQGNDIYRERREQETGKKRKCNEPQKKEVKRVRLDHDNADQKPAAKPSSTKSEQSAPAPASASAPAAKPQGKSMTGEEIAAAVSKAKAIAARFSAEAAKSRAAKNLASSPEKAKSSASPAGEKRKNLDQHEGAVKKIRVESHVAPVAPTVAVSPVAPVATVAPVDLAAQQSPAKDTTPPPSKTEAKSAGVEKRKAEESLESPTKRVRAETPAPPNSLVNNKDACYINASLHLLHSVPAISAMGATAAENLSANTVLTADEVKSANARKRTRLGKELYSRLQQALSAKKASGDFKLRPYLAGQMRHLSATGDDSKGGNTFAFHQVCGELLQSGNGDHMNGETQEDAHEFMTKLMQQIREEEQSAPLETLFDAEFSERKVCECGNTKTFVENTSTFPIPEKYHQQKEAIPMKTVVEDFVSSESGKFDQYECSRCKTSGNWSDKEGGWAGQRLTKSPDFLLAYTSKSHLTRQGQMKKIRTKISPPTHKVSLPSANGSSVDYNMIAMIQHHGNRIDRGHYTTVRKVGDQWYHCDDDGRTGVSKLSRADVEKQVDGTIFLLRKGD